MTFANKNTGEIVDTLPSVIVQDGQTITGATIDQWAAQGWRKIVQVDSPAQGYRVGSYGVTELDELTCKLTVATSINIAGEQAALAAADVAARAAALAATKTLVSTIINAAGQAVDLRGVSAEQAMRMEMANMAWVYTVLQDLLTRAKNGTLTGAKQYTYAEFQTFVLQMLANQQ